ncbi:MAG: hypothetical protein R2795_13865 [Saprospiraceae bacterium]
MVDIIVNTPLLPTRGCRSACLWQRPCRLVAIANGAGGVDGGNGALFANASMASTTYTPTMAEIGTTVTLTWTTADPDGAGLVPVHRIWLTSPSTPLLPPTRVPISLLQATPGVDCGYCQRRRYVDGRNGHVCQCQHGQHDLHAYDG